MVLAAVRCKKNGLKYVTQDVRADCVSYLSNIMRFYWYHLESKNKKERLVAKIKKEMSRRRNEKSGKTSIFSKIKAFFKG